MPSANGYVLEVGEHEVRATWPAPYFVLCRDYDWDDAGLRPILEHEPMLIHCDDLEHARRVLAASRNDEVVMLDAAFVPVPHPRKEHP